MAKAFW